MDGSYAVFVPVKVRESLLWKSVRRQFISQASIQLLSRGFCGYYAEDRDGKPYAGFRFSAVFGFFETGDSDITIPVKWTIDEVVLETRTNENTVWNAQSGALSQSEK